MIFLFWLYYGWESLMWGKVGKPSKFAGSSRLRAYRMAAHILIAMS